MSNEIYEVNLSGAEPVYVEAASKTKAIRTAYRTVSARKLSGSEVRALTSPVIRADESDAADESDQAGV